jgi:hypothetical protein
MGLYLRRVLSVRPELNSEISRTQASRLLKKSGVTSGDSVALLVFQVITDMSAPLK